MKGVDPSYLRQGQGLNGTTSSTGPYCIKVYESGNITPDSTVSYTVTVAHP